jgi:hypothetical protein
MADLAQGCCWNFVVPIELFAHAKVSEIHFPRTERRAAILVCPSTFSTSTIDEAKLAQEDMDRASR